MPAGAVAAAGAVAPRSGAVRWLAEVAPAAAGVWPVGVLAAAAARADLTAVAAWQCQVGCTTRGRKA